MFCLLFLLLSFCICVSEVEARGRQGADIVPVILWYKLKKLVNAWLRTPPLTEPEENALVCEPTVRMMGTVDFISPSVAAL